MATTPRVRFSPAPSGWLHVGSARTALYNWLHARRRSGVFVLRIEDTDAERATEESMRGMIDSLRWLGLDWDEGPEVGGPWGPYRQSERAELYRAIARRLVDAGFVYEAFETAEELEADRERARGEGRPPGYSGAHRDLTDAEKAAFRAEGRTPVLRLRNPDDGAIAFNDAVRGPIEFAWAEIPDLVILRADGSATYPLANTTDDLAHGITLVARGEDLLSATPRQLYLADLLLSDGLLDAALDEVGLPARAPEWDRPEQYAHLPMLVGADRKKLSKRHGAVAVDEFRRQGFLPEVLVNLLALCGWSYDDRTEQFTVPDLVERFGFERVGRNPAYFDTDKLRAFNGDRIKALPTDELADQLVTYLGDQGVISDPATPQQRSLVEAFTPLLQERVQTLADAVPLIGWAFADEVAYQEQSVRKHFKGRAGEALDAAEKLLAEVEWDADAIEERLRALAAELDMGLGKVMQPVRVAVTGSHVSPPLPQTLALLDRETVLERVRAARPLVGQD